MSELIKECDNIEARDWDSDEPNDAGQHYKMTCPNCKSEVRFADCQWWRSDCECGDWDLTIIAKLDPKEVV